MAIDLEKIEESPHLLDLLLFCEDVLDSLDIYVYRNWFDGEVVDGPRVGRHWVSISLLYPLNKMPDPRACLRLLKHGIRVEYSKVEREGEMRGDGGSHGGQSSPLTHAGPHPQPQGSATLLDAEMAPADADAATAASASDASKPGTSAAGPERDWMVKVVFPRRLLDQMAAEDLNMYEDEVDEDDIESAKDSGMNDESAYEENGGQPPAEGEGPDAMAQDDPSMAPPGAPA